MGASELEIAIEQAQKLSPNEKLQLIKVLAEKLSKTGLPEKPKYLIYGEFANTPGREMSTEEDFKIAEWHPTESELNGD